MNSVKSLQVKSSDLAVIEYVTPYKISVAMLLYEFLNLREQRKIVSNDEVLAPYTSQNASDGDKNTVQTLCNLKSVCKLQTCHRRDFCRLLLKLIQNVDKPLSQLCQDILFSKDYELHVTLKTCWRHKLIRLGQDPVSGIMAAINDIVGLLDNVEGPFICKRSVRYFFSDDNKYVPQNRILFFQWTLFEKNHAGV